MMPHSFQLHLWCERWVRSLEQFVLNEFQLTGSCPASHLLACLPEKNLPANNVSPGGQWCESLKSDEERYKLLPSNTF